MMMARFFMTLFLGLLLLSQAGCLVVAAAAGAGAAVAYVQGDLESTVPADPPTVTAAARSAVEEMKLTVVCTKSTGVDGEVVARTAGDDRVAIAIKAEGQNISKVSVRVGTFGDNSLQQTVMDKIKARLPGPTTAPTVAHVR